MSKKVILTNDAILNGVSYPSNPMDREEAERIIAVARRNWRLGIIPEREIPEMVPVDDEDNWMILWASLIVKQEV